MNLQDSTSLKISKDYFIRWKVLNELMRVYQTEVIWSVKMTTIMDSSVMNGTIVYCLNSMEKCLVCIY